MHRHQDTNAPNLGVFSTEPAIICRSVIGTEEGYKLAPFSTLKTLSKSYCLDPVTRVLCSDMIWRPLSQLGMGDELIAFDEYPEAAPTRRGRRVSSAVPQ